MKQLITNIYDLMEDKKTFESELEELREYKCEGDAEIKWIKATIEHIDKLIDTYEYFSHNC